MLKLIASDLDGTLLRPHGVMPEEVFPLIEKFTAKGGVFTPASGRQLPNLKLLFAPVADKIAIIAENGGLVWYGGKVIYSNPTARADVLRTLDALSRTEGLYPVLSCPDCAYYSSDHPDFTYAVVSSYSSQKKVPDLREVAMRETVVKISIWDKRPVTEHGGIVLPPMLEGVRVMISGRDWLDVSTATANKGAALKALMEHIGCAKEDCAAFGDHMNDYEMLCECGHPFVPENAYPPLKAMIGEVILPNTDNGVIKKLQEII